MKKRLISDTGSPRTAKVREEMAVFEAAMTSSDLITSTRVPSLRGFFSKDEQVCEIFRFLGLDGKLVKTELSEHL